MSDDLVERLRELAEFHRDDDRYVDGELCDEAADEIERLRRRRNEYENLYGPPWWTDDEDGA